MAFLFGDFKQVRNDAYKAAISKWLISNLFVFLFKHTSNHEATLRGAYTTIYILLNTCLKVLLTPAF